MVVSIPVQSHLGSVRGGFALLEEKEKEEILISACYKIDELLADMKYLKEFTWLGQQAFYNDTFMQRGRHLKDAFWVSIDPSLTNFLIENDVEVYGANNRSYNLFELLWNRFGPYHVPIKMKSLSAEEEAYYTRTSKMKGKMFAKGGPLIDNSNLMKFHSRYLGKWYYIRDREGMDSSLHSKFRSYIFTAIERGIESALNEHIGAKEFLED